mgnify:CR=1 FL=1
MRQPRDGRLAQAEVPRRMADPLDVETVSYTHLRAHETVLDLVCRLLLEKKKQQPPHTNYSISNTIT